MPYMNLGEFLLATEWENKEVESVVRAIKIAIQDGVRPPMRSLSLDTWSGWLQKRGVGIGASYCLAEPVSRYMDWAAKPDATDVQKVQP